MFDVFLHSYPYAYILSINFILVEGKYGDGSVRA